jgi:uncharacterized coiled-coil DUF342 family protein
MSIGNSVIKSLESDRTKLNTKIAKLYAKRQKMNDQLDSQIYYINGQISEINKNLINYNKENN